MKLLLCILVTIINISSCSRQNEFTRSAIASNKEYQNQFQNTHRIMPKKNIPYAINHSKLEKNKNARKSMQKSAKESYVKHNQDVDDMQEIMSEIVKKSEEIASNQYDKIKYTFNTRTGKYEIDSQNSTIESSIPEMQNRYKFNKRFINRNYRTKIPPKNAYTILSMKKNGIRPNENYFKNMKILAPQVTYKYNPINDYKKTNKEDIYLLAGK